ncbi:MAG: hypothetical protein JWM91_369 [Rhodospirillales bacterium]|nr:hypothetical protein [Rhodospirillales bacterium]
MKIFSVPSAGIGLIAALTFFVPAFAAAPSSHDAGRDTNLTILVEIDGSLPGFSQDQLSAYITQQMGAADVTSWRFRVASPTNGATEPANRVVWHFRLLPFAGGTVRYIGPALSRAREAFGVGHAIGIDVKIYLNGKYQASTFDQVTIKGGPDDPGLIAAIQKVTRTIVSDALTQEMSASRKLIG